MNSEFEGKVVLVTGAARGQGRSHAVEFGRRGAAVIGVDVCRQYHRHYTMPSAADLDETVAMVEEAGGQMLARPADVRDLSSLERAIADGVAEFGGLDVVVANAGLGVGVETVAPSWELDEKAWNMMIDVNLSGVWKTAKATVPSLLKTNRGGAIVITTSLLGLKGEYGVSHYVSSKHGATGLMKSLANELAPHHIRANAVVPTQTLTPMLDHPGTYRAFRPDLENPSREDFRVASAAVHLIPEPWVMPQDITEAVVWLSSDRARFVTGLSLPVDLGAMTK
jgi:(+)-trans-carveol dehydrogenase